MTVKIPLTTEPIKFFILEELHIGPGTVLGYIFTAPPLLSNTEPHVGKKGEYDALTVKPTQLIHRIASPPKNWRKS